MTQEGQRNSLKRMPYLSDQDIYRILQKVLSRDVEGDIFYPVFQAQYNALEERIYGYEVLFRLEIPPYGFVNPERFIAIAERHELMVDLGLKIVDLSLKAFKPMLKKDPSLSLSINVSAKELTKNTYVQKFVDRVKKHGYTNEQLCIEVTESAFADLYEQLIDNTRQLRALGFQVALDDFGKGFSSFRYLVDLDLDIVKIDRYFVNKPIEDKNYEIFISGLIFTLKSLGLTVLIEGIENEEQYRFFQRLGVHQMQGFLLDKPSKLDLKE